MEASFKQALAWVRESEGGNDDDPDDAGGRTSRGITQREYNAYCSTMGIKRGDVWEAPDAIVDDIYHRSYWMPYCPILPPGVDYVFFDECVNAGPGEAVYVLQRALIQMGFDLGPTGADRHIGILTSAALSKADPAKLIDVMSQDRIAVYKAIEARIPRDRKYDRGWMRRVAFAQDNAHKLLTKDARPVA